MKTENWKEWNPGVEVTLADDLCVILRNVEFKDEAHIAQVIVDLENLFEQRLLLSSEAEKGEGEDPIYGRLYSYDDMKKAWDTGKRNKAEYQETNWIDFEDFIRSLTPSPPSPQEKQGVEECNHNYVFLNDNGDVECSHCSRTFVFDSPAPAAPDKGEGFDVPERSDKELIEMITTHRSPSVEKSEGEEAVASVVVFLAERLEKAGVTRDEISALAFGECVDAIEEYSLLHSSGDRGRKEGEAR